MNLENASRAVVAVELGRGFVIETLQTPLVITAAHCLPVFPPYGSFSCTEERTYKGILGQLGQTQSIWAECLFADPIGDIAVLGPPDDQKLPDAYEAYQALAEAMVPLGIADAPNEGPAWLLSLNGQWSRCMVRNDSGTLWISDAAAGIFGGMSGSPIIGDGETAIGVLVCSGGSGEVHTERGPNPSLLDKLPGWLLREAGLLHQYPIQEPAVR
jgi:hypothetical protein